MSSSMRRKTLQASLTVGKLFGFSGVLTECDVQQLPAFSSQNRSHEGVDNGNSPTVGTEQVQDWSGRVVEAALFSLDFFQDRPNGCELI